MKLVRKPTVPVAAAVAAAIVAAAAAVAVPAAAVDVAAAGKPNRFRDEIKKEERKLFLFSSQYSIRIETHAPRYACFTWSFSNSFDAVSVNTIFPVSSTYARCAICSDFRAFCSTSKQVIPLRLISVIA